MMKPILLASSSPYRRTLLQRLGLPFSCASPDIDETPQPGEPADALAVRLAAGKAEALARQYPDTLIIGSDQVATLPDGTLLNKLARYGEANLQWTHRSVDSVRCLTELAVVDSGTGTRMCGCERSDVHFRALSATEIENYLRKDQPYDCARRFKMEGLGIA